MGYLVGFLLLASLVTGLMLRDRLGLLTAPAGERDDATAALPGGVATQAIVQRLTQDGMSKGIVSHQCRLDLLVRHPHTEALTTVSVARQLDTDVLRYFVPGSMIEALVDPADLTRVAVSVPATRARATGRTTLPPATCKGIPDAVYLKPTERHIEGGVPGRAVLCCIDPDTPPHSVVCNTTFGLWVIDPAGLPGPAVPGADPPAIDPSVAADPSAADEPGYEPGYETVITDRLTITELLCFPRGIELPVVINPIFPKRVAIDCEAARLASMEMLVPPVDAFAGAAAALGQDGIVATVAALSPTGSQHGVRYGCSVSVTPHGGDASTMRLTVSLAMPDLVALVPGSPVIVTRDSGAVDLDATARVRAHAALMASGWGA